MPTSNLCIRASMTDTGNSQAAFPYQSAAQSTPCGETFFRMPANRWSDGRVVVDFFAQALKIPLLSPHSQSVGYDFTHGANFAFSAVTTQNNSYPATVSPPFYFWVQTKQFQYFKERTRALWKNAVKELYKQGARTLMVFNVPPLGCYPSFLISSLMRNMSTVDTYGCLATLNAAIEATNSLIQTGLQELQVKHPDATIIYADLYKVLEKVYRNGTSHGFKEVFKVCCGGGGGAYNTIVTCGASAVVNGELVQGKPCSEPGTYIHWDGIH